MKINKERLQIAMARRCINHQELAKCAKICYPTLMRATETGKTKPSTVGKIALALHCDVSDILE